MNPKTTKMIEKRKRLLRRMTGLDLLAHGSYLERFSTCSRKSCACHQGKKKGGGTRADCGGILMAGGGVHLFSLHPW